MALHTLEVHNLRIIEHLAISLAANANLFVGENGAGKTSILEAIDILSRGRSFRDRRTRSLIRQHAEDLVINSMADAVGGQVHLGIQKSANQTLLHCNHEKVASISNHASYLPVVSMHPDSHQLIQGGSKYRRNYLDWSAFHVKPSFLQYWREYAKCLKQRNKALRDYYEEQQLNEWTRELCTKANLLDQVRSKIFREISTIFTDYSRKLLPECEVSLSYDRGWPKERILEDLLLERVFLERQRKLTGVGAHRADVKLYLNQQPAATTASRGQQKLLVACLLLAQIEHFQQHTSQMCIVLLDDIKAELDKVHAASLLTALQSLGCQVFITAIEAHQVDLSGWENTSVFHVKQGVCTPILNK